MARDSPPLPVAATPFRDLAAVLSASGTFVTPFKAISFLAFSPLSHVIAVLAFLIEDDVHKRLDDVARRDIEAVSSTHHEVSRRFFSWSIR